jgi:hypothetical protein
MFYTGIFLKTEDFGERSSYILINSASDLRAGKKNLS